MIRPYETINSFTRRPVISQIVAYLVFIGEALTFFICMYVNFTSSARQIAILVLYIVTVIIQVVVTFITSYIDPSDSLMIEFRNDEKSRKNIELQFRLYCQICTAYVNQTSRHCKACQRYNFFSQNKVFYCFIRRCVEKFDHHCMWINNCIGIKNYRVFIAMIIFTFVNMIVYVIGMILLWTEDGWKQYIGPMVAIWVYSVIMLVFAVLLLNLICLHMYLIYKGLTTYQFIIEQRRQQRLKEVEKKEKKRIDSQLQKEKSRKEAISHQIEVRSQNTGNQVSSLQRSENQLSKANLNKQQSKHKSGGSNCNILVNDKIQLVPIVEILKEESVSNSEQVSVNDSSTLKNRQQEQSNEELDWRQEQNLGNISSFFVKNKSLTFFVGNQIGDRPKSALFMTKPLQNHFYTIPQKKSVQSKVNKTISYIIPVIKKETKHQSISNSRKTTINFQSTQTQTKQKI